MKRTRRPKARTGVARLEDFPNIGVSMAGDLRLIGIAGPADLPGRDPYALYDELYRVPG